MNTTEVMVCECASMEHIVCFGYWNDEPEVYVSVHLKKHGFLKRLIYAVKYLFGHQCKYGAFEAGAKWQKEHSDKELSDKLKQEWSKEDEDHVNSLLKRLEGLCRNEFATTRFAINEDEDWLKSLRPQNKWKPSDEQMECLSDAIKHYNSLGYDAHILKELLNDLKKLREE